MPDLANRFEHEAKLTSILARLQASQRVRLENALGWPPNINNVPPQLWLEVETELRQKLAAQLLIVYLLSLEGMEFHSGFRLSPEVSIVRAQQWSDGYSSTLAREITVNSRAMVQDLVARAGPVPGAPTGIAGVRTQLAKGDFKNRLSTIFGDRRAESIGVTETTRAAVAGEKSAVSQFETASGKLLVPYWETAQDDRVCPVCQPLDGAREEEWQTTFPSGPPAHVRCRCYLIWELETER